jgi:pyruvate,water dikinase
MTADPLHHRSGPDTAWSRVNTAEALPGVLTPLGWTFWMEPLERAMRGAFADIGVLRPSEVRVAPSVDDRYSAIFYGRFSGNINEMRRMADQMPGTSGDALELQLFGALRPGVVSKRSFHRYPVVAAQMPRAALSAPKVLARKRAENDAWWRACTSPAIQQDVAGARARFAEAMVRFEGVMRPHSVVTMLGQALGDQIHKLAAAAGRPDLEPTLMTGYGGMEETRLMADLWAVSRGRGTLEGFLADHGYHGPSEGELSTRSWHEEPAPVLALLETYRGMDETSDPRRVEAQRARERESTTAELMRLLPKVRQAGARVVLGAAKRYVPLREVGKASFLQTLDVGRAAARTLGEDLARAGHLGDPEDVFYLTADELLGQLPPEPKETVTARRQQREEYQRVRLPDLWVGMPEPILIETEVTDDDVSEVTGVAVSPGVVEGRVRVVLDPTQPLEPGEILVCETTDPSWTSMFLVAAGLVIDIGGTLSHGAIVARELGVPCVINTRVGTRTLRTGDLVRVDGGAGRVDILERA